MATIDREAARAAGYSDAEIDAFERRAGLTPSTAPAQAPAAMPSVAPRATQGPAPLTAGEVASGALLNLPSSTFNLAKGLYEAVTSPVQTAKGLLDIAAGGLQNLLPENFVKLLGEDKASREVANQVGRFYADRYGSVEGAKRAIANDPAGVMADLSTFLTAGATALPRGAVATKMTQAAQMVDPLQITAKGVAAAGRGVAPVVGMTTGVGTEAARQALRAGFEGGDISKLFVENLRGKVPATDVLPVVRQNLEVMRADRQANYLSDMTAVKNDKSILSFTEIDKALTKAEQIAKFKGQVVDKKSAQVIDEIKDVVNNWKSLNPAEFHTPEGIDKLKQAIGGILEDIPYRTQARTVAGGIYDSVKKQISNQAPGYAKAMQDYSKASDLITEIESALKAGDKTSVDTAMRQLQSLMRNNVQTNYGQRLALAKELEAAGGREFMPALAGQAMSELAPRGLQRATTVPSTFMAYGAGGLPTAAGMAAISSPRLMGEALYGAGRVGKGISRAVDVLPDANYPALGNIAYQSGLLGTNLELSEEMRRRQRAAGLFSGAK